VRYNKVEKGWLACPASILAAVFFLFTRVHLQLVCIGAGGGVSYEKNQLAYGRVMSGGREQDVIGGR
jgi:hypothetical protein